MAVYVDNAKNPYRGMLMSHMIADTEVELHKMAAQLGLKKQWYQAQASFPHYDVCQNTRMKAIKLGAQPIHTRELITKIQGLRRCLAR